MISDGLTEDQRDEARQIAEIEARIRQRKSMEAITRSRQPPSKKGKKK